MNMTQLRNRVAALAVVASPRGVVLAALASPLVSHAAAITVPTELADAAASVVTVGTAVFAIAVGVKLYKWIARAL